MGGASEVSELEVLVPCPWSVAESGLEQRDKEAHPL